MYRKKRIEKKYIILISVVIIGILLGLITNIVRTNRTLSPVEKSIKDTVLLGNKVLYAPIKFVKDKIKTYQDKQNLYKKYQALEKKVKETDLINAERLELKKELNTMKKTLELNQTLGESNYLNATVVNRNLGYWYNTITIDKGSNNGVKPDMAVVVSEGLIGKVTKTTNFNSTVKLLTSDDINNKISVKIQIGDQYVYGLLSGFNQKKKTFTIEGISSNMKIPKDSLVTTTGMGDIFPSGIVIGKVKKVRTDNFDLAKTVDVVGSADFDDLTYVTVLKRKGA
ncbi:MAG: rod shape-determining protein MreC [Bacilli bacterium]|nr:rod shape-determining protein MreC [Bacilli bacterium]